MQNRFVYIKFRFICKETRTCDKVFVSGNINELGNWNTNNAIQLFTSRNKFPEWESNEITIEVDEASENLMFEYKYFIKSSGGGKILWECFGENRNINLSLNNTTEDNIFIINGEHFNDI